MYLNEATLLNNLRVRYMKDYIYVRNCLILKFFKINLHKNMFHSVIFIIMISYEILRKFVIYIF